MHNKLDAFIKRTTWKHRKTFVFESILIYNSIYYASSTTKRLNYLQIFYILVFKMIKIKNKYHKFNFIQIKKVRTEKRTRKIKINRMNNKTQ